MATPGWLAEGRVSEDFDVMVHEVGEIVVSRSVTPVPDDDSDIIDCERGVASESDGAESTWEFIETCQAAASQQWSVVDEHPDLRLRDDAEANSQDFAETESLLDIASSPSLLVSDDELELELEDLSGISCNLAASSAEVPGQEVMGTEFEPRSTMQPNRQLMLSPEQDSSLASSPTANENSVHTTLAESVEYDIEAAAPVSVRPRLDKPWDSPLLDLTSICRTEVADTSTFSSDASTAAPASDVSSMLGDIDLTCGLGQTGGLSVGGLSLPTARSAHVGHAGSEDTSMNQGRNDCRCMNLCCKAREMFANSSIARRHYSLDNCVSGPSPAVIWAVQAWPLGAGWS
jgi:hypothetical protein